MKLYARHLHPQILAEIKSDLNKYHYLGSHSKRAKEIIDKLELSIHWNNLRADISYIWSEYIEGMGIIKQNEKTTITSDKEVGFTNWKEFVDIADKIQGLKKKGSFLQDTATINFKTDQNKIIVLCLSDLHLGSYATNYTLFKEFTKYILETKNLYVALFGDLTDNFVNFKKNIGAMFGQIFSPEQQDKILESWLEEIKDKLLFATWCNHSEMEEKQTGKNRVKDILASKTVYFKGIGKCDITFNNKITYRIGVTHKTRWHSSDNLTHGLKKLFKNDFQDCDIAIAGDKHEPAVEQTHIGGKERLAILIGSLKNDDLFSKRYFSFFSHATMPSIVFDTNEKRATPFFKVADAIEFCKG